MHKEKNRYLVLFSAVIFYLVSHVILIFSLPIINDEAIYVRWGQLIFQGKSIFLPLENGIGPLFMWLIALSMFVIHDPLIAGRCVSIALGLLSLIGVWKLTNLVFSNRSISSLSLFFFLFSPFSIFYEHFVLLDVAVATLGIWSIYFMVLFAKKKSFLYAVTAGVLIGFSMLAKSSGQLFLFLTPVAMMFAGKIKKNTIFLAVVVFLFTSIIANCIYAFLKLSPLFERTLWLSGSFVYPKHEWIHLPPLFIMQLFFGNVLRFLSYLKYDIPVSWLLLFLFGFEKKYRKNNVMLLLFFCVPIIIVALFAKPDVGPRHLYSYSIVLLPFFACAFYVFSAYILKLPIASFLKKFIIFAYCVLLISQAVLLYKDLLLGKRTDLVIYAESFLYIDQCGSGTGLNLTINYFKNKNEPIYIGTKGIFGLVPQGLQIYLSDKKNIFIEGFLSGESILPDKVSVIQKKERYFVIIEKSRSPLLSNPNLTVVIDTKDSREDCHYRVYQFKNIDLYLHLRGDLR